MIVDGRATQLKRTIASQIAGTESHSVGTEVSLINRLDKCDTTDSTELILCII